MAALDVFLHDERVGVLERRRQARLRFTYSDPQSAAPLSCSLPPRSEPFGDDECRGFFAGLLPEDDLLRTIARAFGTSAANAFSLLDAIGGECAGAVSLVPPGQEPPGVAVEPRALDEPELATLLEQLPERPLLTGAGEGIRLSLAGSQSKTALHYDATRFAITAGSPPTTHILKPPIERFDDTVANEAFCLALAQQAGLDAALAEPREADGHEFLLVTRYDRESTEVGPRRIHQEDACQALGRVPALKYQADGGPGVADLAGLLDRASAAAGADRLALLDAVVFNYAIGNADAHAKNYSLIHTGDVRVRLAPLYDLVSTAVYPELHSKMAMKLGGEYRPDYVRARHLERLFDDLALAHPPARRRVLTLLERIEEGTTGARESLPAAWRDREVLDRIATVLVERTAHLSGELRAQPSD